MISEQYDKEHGAEGSYEAWINADHYLLARLLTERYSSFVGISAMMFWINIWDGYKVYKSCPSQPTYQDWDARLYGIKDAKSVGDMESNKYLTAVPLNLE